MKKDYVKQLEVANEELQRKLLEQADIMDSLSAAFAQTRNEMKRSRLVVVCSNEREIFNSSMGKTGVGIGELVYKVNLIVIPATPEEKQKVFEAYQISPDVKLSLFKSVKDRNNKQGSIYDADMLNDYATGLTVKPYQI